MRMIDADALQYRRVRLGNGGYAVVVFSDDISKQQTLYAGNTAHFENVGTVCDMNTKEIEDCMACSSCGMFAVSETEARTRKRYGIQINFCPVCGARFE